MDDFYSILGVEPNASAAEIKRMYHKLSKKYHPDVNIEDPDLRQWSDARMKELNEAYDTLKDPLKRAEYDRRRGYVHSSPPPPAWPPRPSVVTEWQQSVVVRSAAISAVSFGLVGLLRGGIPFAVSGAIIGAIFWGDSGEYQAGRLTGRRHRRDFYRHVSGGGVVEAVAGRHIDWRPSGRAGWLVVR